jgi:hypothetical protein
VPKAPEATSRCRRIALQSRVSGLVYFSSSA